MMFLHVLLIISVALDVAKSLSTGRDLFVRTDFLDSFDSDPWQTSDSLFLADNADPAAGDLANLYSPDDELNFDDNPVTLDSSEDEPSIGDTSEGNLFASSNPADLFDEGDLVMDQTSPSLCEGNLIDPASALTGRSLNSRQTSEELDADSLGNLCLPTKTEFPEPKLPNNLDDLYDELNPKPPVFIDPIYRTSPYRVICPLNGDFSIVCCAAGASSEGSKKVKCISCKF